MEYILTSLDIIAGITENLINYTFNVCLQRVVACFGTLTDPNWSIGLADGVI